MIDIYDLPQEEAVYQNIFWKGRTTGVFQFSSNNAKHLCRQIKPKSIYDLAVINALNRPAILDAGVDQDYIACRQGLQQPKKIHPIVDKISAPTYGLMPFQEQVMEVCIQFANFTYPEADALRKAMKHKSGEEFEAYRTKFVENAIKKSNQSTAEYVWNLVEKFSGYGFCLAGDTLFKTPYGDKALINLKPDDKIFSLNTDTNESFVNEIVTVHDNGEKDLYEIEFDNGEIIKSTMEHTFLCKDNQYHTLKDIIKKSLDIVVADDMI